MLPKSAASKLVLRTPLLALGVLLFGCGGGGQSAPPIIPVGGQIKVSIIPESVIVQLGASTKFTATVTNDATNQGVTWQLMQTVNGGLARIIRERTSDGNFAGERGA